MYSGIPSQYLIHAPNVTLEGDNVLLSLQVARYLTRQYNPRDGNLTAGIGTHELYDALLNAGLNYMINRIVGKFIVNRMVGGRTGPDSNTISQTAAVDATKLFSYIYTNTAFHEAVQAINDAQIRHYLDCLREIYAIRKI
jgi:hypothetical protein